MILRVAPVSAPEPAVEQLFHVMKRQFGFTKARYLGLAKNTNHLLVCCALINLVMSKRQLLKAAR